MVIEVMAAAMVAIHLESQHFGGRLISEFEDSLGYTEKLCLGKVEVENLLNKVVL